MNTHLSPQPENTNSVSRRRLIIQWLQAWFAALAGGALVSCDKKRQDHYRFSEPTPTYQPEAVSSLDLIALSQELSQILGRPIRLISQTWEGQPDGDYLQGKYLSLVHDNPEEFVFKLIFDKNGRECLKMIRELPSDTVLVKIPGKLNGTNMPNPAKKMKKGVLVEKVHIGWLAQGNQFIEKVRQSIATGHGEKSYHTTTREGQFANSASWVRVVRGSPGLSDSLVVGNFSEDVVEVWYGIRVPETHTFETLAGQGFSRESLSDIMELKGQFMGKKLRTFTIRDQSFQKNGWKWEIMSKNLSGDVNLKREDWKLVISWIYIGG